MRREHLPGELLLLLQIHLIFSSCFQNWNTPEIPWLLLAEKLSFSSSLRSKETRWCVSREAFFVDFHGRPSYGGPQAQTMFRGKQIDDSGVRKTFLIVKRFSPCMISTSKVKNFPFLFSLFPKTSSQKTFFVVSFTFFVVC